MKLSFFCFDFNFCFVCSSQYNKAKNLNLRKLSIETGSGDFFKPARQLFQKIGFKKCSPFAHYKEDPNSCYMNLDI